MPFNCPLYRDSLHKVDAYLGKPDFNTGFISASSTKEGHVIIDGFTRKPLSLVMVGRIGADGLWCSPTGDYRPGYNVALKDAHARFCLQAPVEQAFKADFDRAVQMLYTLMPSHAASMPPKQVINDDTRTGLQVRFSKRLFEERANPVANRIAYELEGEASTVYVSQPITTTPSPGPHDTDVLEGEEMVDDPTYFWPVPADLREDYDRITTSHAVSPVQVLKRWTAVDTLEVESALKGSLAEVHFNLFRVGENDYRAEATLVNVLKGPKTVDLRKASKAAKRKAKDVAKPHGGPPSKRSKPSGSSPASSATLSSTSS